MKLQYSAGIYKGFGSRYCHTTDKNTWKISDGVVPEIASRKHIEAISIVTKEAIEKAGIEFKDIDAVACTYGPGLVGALLVGVRICKSIKLC